MADPIMVAIATAAVGKAAESLTDQVSAIVRRIREKFRDNPAGLATLDAAQHDPSAVEHLAVLLDETSAADPRFGAELRALWERVRDQGVVNIFYGQADKVIQLRDVHGDLNIS